MQLLPPEELTRSKLTSEQRLFVESLYQMIHLESLDSYRAKCLNLRTIVAEFYHELQTGRLEEDELACLCAECVEFLEMDPIGIIYYKYHYSIILPLLQSIPATKAKKGSEEAQQVARKIEHLTHCLADLSVELETNYFSLLCKELPQALESNDGNKIVLLTGGLLSDLVYQGYSYVSLYQWHKKFLKQDKFQFADNIGFMLKTLQMPRSPYNVTLQLSGSEKLVAIGCLGRFQFQSKSIPPESAPANTKRFFADKPLRSFAVTEIESTDFESAALQARAEVELLLDLMRLEYVNTPVAIDDQVHVIRQKDNRDYLVRIKNALPNPIEDISHVEFLRFAAQIENALEKRGIEEGTIEQVRASIRQYRIGRDSLRSEDKCLYWWMGLEALANVGGTHIGQTVVTNVSRVLANGYYYRIIHDLLETLRRCKIAWTAELKTASRCESLESLTELSLIGVLQDSAARAKLLIGCQDHPIISHYADPIGKSLDNPKEAKKVLIRHLSHVEWQVRRLYRIRCCIVHGSKVAHTLAPFAANMEYYLKQVIILVLKCLVHYKQIRSRAQIFQRASLAFDRKVTELENAKDNKVIKQVIFEDIVLANSKSTLGF